MEAEWLFIQPFPLRCPSAGAKPTTDLRVVPEALRYLARTGGGWRVTPNDLPPWQTVCWWVRRFVRRLLFRPMHDVPMILDQQRENREQSPSAAVIDSQSVKMPAAEERRYDAGKKVVGRKLHRAVDTDGRPLMVNPSTADISDSACVQAIVAAVRERWRDRPPHRTGAGLQVLPKRQVVGEPSDG